MKSTSKRLNYQRDAGKRAEEKQDEELFCFMRKMMRQLLIPVMLLVVMFLLLCYDANLVGYKVQRSEDTTYTPHINIQTYKQSIDVSTNDSRVTLTGEIVWSYDGKIKVNVNLDPQKHSTGPGWAVADVRVISTEHNEKGDN